MINQRPYKKRVFWLGMHKVLIQTELPRLRKLGYEVFNPPYLSEVPDQSANLAWDSSQETTLPNAVFDKISSYNFFYNEINDEIAEILNTYFDAVVVTISALWLSAIAKVYRGRIIFRTYGQHTLLSNDLAANDLLVNLSSRSNFHFVPHAEEALENEHSWLKRKAQVIPYCLPPDIFEHSDTWTGSFERASAEIALTCPNIDNAFFAEHYRFLKGNFPESFYKFFGVQLSTVDDKQIVGTLARNELISRMKRCAAYLYTYTDSRVCYLPPIEMMVLGGPVLFLKGSLLDKYFGENAPGRCENVEDARAKAMRLLDREDTFLSQILASQALVLRRYHPDFVWPVFDEYFSNIFNEQLDPERIFRYPSSSVESSAKRIYMLHHFPGEPVVWDGQKYSAYDGIPRVMRQIAKALLDIRDVEICITARHDQAQSIYGYFSSDESQRNRVKVLIVDDVTSKKITPDNQQRLTRSLKTKIKSLVPSKYWPLLWKASIIVRRTIALLRTESFSDPGPISYSKQYTNHINQDESSEFVIIPHYYCFPEALQITKKKFLYLPDYMPHFFHHTGEFRGDEGAHTDIGREMVKHADVVFCNSVFTRDYLPNSRLQVQPDKIKVFYLPLLNSNDSRPQVNAELDYLRDRKFLFYPTQPRPNKNLSLLLKVFDALVADGLDLWLVLTAKLDPEPKAMATFNSIASRERVIFTERVSDEALAWLYKNASLLCFTSLAEGNFPPQILEALAYDTPVVASNLGFVTERIPTNLSNSLLLCNPEIPTEFIEACKYALDSPKECLDRQLELKRALLGSDSDTFISDVESTFFLKEFLCTSKYHLAG